MIIEITRISQGLKQMFIAEVGDQYWQELEQEMKLENAKCIQFFTNYLIVETVSENNDDKTFNVLTGVSRGVVGGIVGYTKTLNAMKAFAIALGCNTIQTFSCNAELGFIYDKLGAVRSDQKGITSVHRWSI